MRPPFDIRAAYRTAMRCYRIAKKLPHTKNPGPGTVLAYGSAVAMVRTITGLWDIPQQSFVTVRRGQRQRLLDCDWARQPTWRQQIVNQAAVDFGATPRYREVLMRPGKLHVMRSMTEFCRRTRHIKPVPWVDWGFFYSHVVPYFGLDESCIYERDPHYASRMVGHFVEQMGEPA